MTEPLSPTSPPEPVAGDTKDWTWVLDRPCSDCGFDPATVHAPDLPDLIHDNTKAWYDVLDRPDVSLREVKIFL